jgi:MinD superfamily P-loop ATPase
MKLAVASGKGGTGKTMLAVALARSLAESGEEDQPAPLLLDCDVEAPDGQLFLRPRMSSPETVSVPVPRVAAESCSLCGECARACRFNAIAVLGAAVRVFPELCHSCGSCSLLCPEGAIIEVPRAVGRMEWGLAETGVRYARGVLNVGEAMAVPVIRRLRARVESGAGDTILDAPPGTSCPVVETVRGCDYVILVTEPTPFGLHDLELAVDLTRALGIPAGVVVTRDGPTPYRALDRFCEREALPILLRIPFARRIAEAIARGESLLDAEPRYRVDLRRLVERIRDEVAGAAAGSMVLGAGNANAIGRGA